MWTRRLVIFGALIGFVVGFGLPSAIDPDAVGGGGVKLLIQIVAAVIVLKIGIFFGAMFGTVFDGVGDAVYDAKRKRRYGSYMPHRPVTDKDREAALDAIASRIKRGGSTPDSSSNALVGEVVHHPTPETEKDDDDFWARVENASKQKPLNWQD